MLCFTAKNIIFIKNSEVKNHFAEKLLFYYLFFLLNKASLITLFGSFISNIIIQTMRPNAIIEKPKNASFSISSGAGVKYAAFNSEYSTTPSTNHLPEAPQKI